MATPQDIQSTLDWLIKIDELSQARSLALTFARFLPPNHPETSDFLAMMLHRTKFYDEALEWARKTVELIPDHLEARYNLARCLHSCGKSLEAEKEIDRVVAAKPDWTDPQLDRSMYICSQGRVDEAEKILLGLQSKIPSHDQHADVVKYNLAWHMIRHGKFKEGMQALSVGRKLRVFGAQAGTYPKPKYFKGLPIAGKTVLFVGEAGAGDEIINARFPQILKAQGARCVWSTGQGMNTLFSRVPGIDQVVKGSEIKDLPYDYWIPSMDVVGIMGLDLPELPKEAYLTADPVFVEKWKTRIPSSSRIKVGLRWQGNPLYEQDLHRSVPFELYRNFLGLEGFEFYSLQRDSGVEELSSNDPVVDLSSELRTWEDTAAAISQLDLVISSCTSIAHLAGALGKKTFVFTPINSYYVWAYPGEKSVWYPDVKLFRQKNFRNWDVEAQQVLEDLKRMKK